jgi:sugar phosphate isomerase/epimerase
LAYCDRTIKEILERAVKFGYDGIELKGGTRNRVRAAQEHVYPEMSPKIRELIKELFSTYNVDISCVSAYTNFSNLNPMERESNVKTLNAYVDLAADLDCDRVRTFGSGRTGALYPNYASMSEKEHGATPINDDAQKRVVTSLKKCAAYAEKKGVIICLETHDDFNTGAKVRRVIDEVDSPALKVNYDVSHPALAYEPLEETMRYLHNCIDFVHFKDVRRLVREDGSEGHDLVLLGEGIVKTKEILVGLKKMSYDGYLSIEWEKLWRPSIPDSDVAMEQFVKKIREILKEIAS